MDAPNSFKLFQRKGRAIMRLRPAWMSYWRFWIALITASGVWCFIYLQQFENIGDASLTIALLPSIVALPILAWVLFHRYTRSFEIEDGKILRTTIGLISRVKREYTLSDKVQIDASQTVPARLFNYGTIGFWAGDDRSRMEWRNINDPDKVVSFMRALSSGEVLPHLVPGASSATAIDASDDSEDHVSPVFHPPAGVTFGTKVVCLPYLPAFMARIAGVPRNLVQSYQWVERGQPLLAVNIQVGDGSFVGGPETIDITVPSPVSGLVILRGHTPSDATDPWERNRTTLLPTSDDAAAEEGAYLFQDLRQQLWTHRDYVFRENRTMRLMREAGGWREEFADRWIDDSGIRAALDEICARSCDTLEPAPHLKANFAEAVQRYPALQPLLAELN